jgi:hypothetical protein
VFTVKGLCYESDVDWNYYMALDNKNRLAYFDGYKDTAISPLKDNGGWEISSKHEKEINFNAKIISKKFSTIIPVGRYNWYINDARCKYDQRKSELTLSKCKFGTQFTCDSGHCVDLNHRCDGVVDCSDESDEEDCYLINTPPSYRKDDPPKPMTNANASHLQTSVEVINIDFISTIDMTVGITVGIRIKWLDGRLDYFNPFPNKANVIPTDTLHRIWLPSRYLIIENAVLGQIEYDNNKRVILHPNVSQNIKIELPRENRVFNGSTSFLEVFQRMKLKYNCLFDVYKFPFDEQECNLVFTLEQSKINKVDFVMDKLVTYYGSSTVDQFRIGRMSTNVSNVQESTKFILTIPFDRVSTNQLLKTFLPTFLLCFLGYATMMVDIHNASDRFIGSVTMMLVLTTWISVINADLPRTSYVKLVDCWFVWHVTISFLIIIYHISLDKLQSISFGSNIIQVEEYDQSMRPNRKATKPRNALTKKVNTIALITFFFLNCTFYAVYWILSLY